jgi:hypothetical protein
MCALDLLPGRLRACPSPRPGYGTGKWADTSRRYSCAQLARLFQSTKGPWGLHVVAKFALALGTIAPAVAAPAQCGIQSKPIAGFNWYRSEGWPTPGADDVKSILPLTVNRNGVPLIVNGREDDWPEGLTASRLTQERNYHLVFPSWVTATSYLTSLTLCPSCLLDLEAEPV